jgi:hypothetical protein
MCLSSIFSVWLKLLFVGFMTGGGSLFFEVKDNLDMFKEGDDLRSKDFLGELFLGRLLNMLSYFLVDISCIELKFFLYYW